jgi:hypothetical protein
MRVIWTGFLIEMFRVRLLSMPQQIIESVTSKGPSRLNLLRLESQVRNTPAVAMQVNASHNLFPAFSLKKITAMIAVKTPSRLRSNDVAKPDMRLNPIMRQIGAIIPPDSVAPKSQGTSSIFRLTFLALVVEAVFRTTE